MNLNLDFLSMDNQRFQIDDENADLVVEQEENKQQENKEVPKETKETKSTKDNSDLIAIDDDTPNVEGTTETKEINPPSNKTYKGYAAALVEEGVINLNLDEFNKLPVEQQVKKLIEATDTQIENKAIELHNQFKQTYPDKIRRILDNFEDGLDIDKAISHTSKIEVYNDYKENIEDESVAKKVLIEEKINNGLSKEEAIEEVENILEPIKSAKSSINRLIKAAEKKIEQEKVQQQENFKKQQEYQKQQIDTFNKYVQETNEFIKGVPVTKKDKEAIKSLMLDVSGKDSSGNAVTKMLEDRSKNPLEFDTKIAYLYHITKGFTSIDRVEGIAKSKAIKSLEQEVSQSTLNEGNSYQNSNDEENLDNKINSFTRFLSNTTRK